MTEKRITQLTLALAIALFISALTQPAYCTASCKNSLMVFLVGILGILTELGALMSCVLEGTGGLKDPVGATFSWLANPFLFISMIVFAFRKKAALVSSIISTLLVLYFLLFSRVIDDAGHYNKVTALGLGYWLWLSSSLVILIGSMIVLKTSKNETAEGSDGL